MPQLPFVFFDAAGTLFHLSESVGAGYSRIAADFGFQLDPAATDAAFRTAFAAVEQPSYIHGPDEDADRCWWKEFVAWVFSEAGEEPQRSSFSDCFDVLFSFYGKADAWQLFPETVDTLHLLQSKGFEIGVLSNFDRRLCAILDALDIGDAFSHVIISSEIGAAKPHPKIFHTAAERVGRSPGDCILIGDDPQRDQTGGLAAGYQAVHLVNRPSEDLKTLANTVISGISS
ncbi:MAG: HAD-IA family hydrolase [Verrucomicrobiae bacterium]|nr:HAD-IA family hydrolase [Verrucomicrobiae bacterium]